ncbi:uncharacterized protein LOC121380216 isoform X2 [Gigantopelta aegis]|nr:uncharacterized protein LOC121380216 isoform X2 [Gigantopelta aegis]
MDTQGHFAQSKLFQYLWSNSADTDMKKTLDDFNASIECKFVSGKVIPGQYLMTVIVYVHNTWPRNIVVYGSIQFDLTESLNGNLNISQHLPYQRNNSTFSTGEMVTVHANVTDKFPTKKSSEFLPKVEFVYYWFRNTTFIKRTRDPFFNFTPSDTGNFTMSTEIIAVLRSDEMPRTNTSLSEASKPCESFRMHRLTAAPHRIRRGRRVVKCGIMEQPVSVKESLRFVSIEGDTDGPVGGAIKMNVTCHGSSPSFPTAVCWNITDTNFSLPIGNASCEPAVFVHTCEHHVEISLNTSGWHIVWFTVYNDVSFITGRHVVLAYAPDSTSSSVLVIPVVFSILGIVIVVLGVGYILRLKKKPLVEVADFDFHPSLSPDQSLLSRAKAVWFKARSLSGLPRYEPPRNKRYGSVNINETL